MLLAMGLGFCYEPLFAGFCGNLSSMESIMNNASFQGANDSQTPEEFLLRINEKIEQNQDLKMLIGSLNGIIFSAEIYYNETSCFSGSLKFSNSSLEYFKFEAHEAKGSSNENIYFHAELAGIEKILNEWIALSKMESNPVQTILLSMKTIVSTIISILSNDFYVKPISGLFKVFDLLKALPQMSFSKEIVSISGNITSGLI